jgi:hypothetical protein
MQALSKWFKHCNRILSKDDLLGIPVEDEGVVFFKVDELITRSATPDTKPNGTTGLQPQMNLSHVNEKRALYKLTTLYMALRISEVG